MTTSNISLMDLADDIAAIVEQCDKWARSASNSGPFSEEAFRSSVYINGTLRLLEQRLRARAEASND